MQNKFRNKKIFALLHYQDSSTDVENVYHEEKQAFEKLNFVVNVFWIIPLQYISTPVENVSDEETPTVDILAELNQIGKVKSLWREN